MQKQSEALGMKVSGNIITELSDRIPSNFMALNELIKNAYDADASSIDIEIVSDKKLITVRDTGIGMDRAGIENLLHIARSNKSYAIKRKNGRITQGEKGLGTLATFHFGNVVTWETSQDGKIAHKFTVEKEKIMDSEDISEYETVIEELPTEIRGTKITISEVNEEDFKFMLETLKNKKTTSKLVRSLYESENYEELEVNISIDGNPVIDNEDLFIKEVNNNERLYNVKYKSKKSTIYFYYNDAVVLEVPFVLDKSLSEFEIKLNLNIYDFSGKVKNSDFPALYHKEQEKDDITPLVYINQGFFKNYNLFDVDILRRTDSGKVLAQITGEIEIKTQSSRLKFNADRTEINENVITLKLKTEIERLNMLIQETGSIYKYPFIALNRNEDPFFNSKQPNRFILKNTSLDTIGLSKKDIEELVKNNFSNEIFSKITNYKIQSDKVIYNFLGKKKQIVFEGKNEKSSEVFEPKLESEDEDSGNKSKKFSSAIIKLKKKKKKIEINSPGQVDLYDYIVTGETINSRGFEIPLEDIKISDDKGLMKSSNTNILPNVDRPQKVTVKYSYNDENTGLTSSTLEFIFLPRENKPIKGSISIGQKGLIHSHGIGNFEITFDTVSSSLVNQINGLVYEEYLEMIACSLRSMFELGIDAIRNKDTDSIVLEKLQSDIETGGLESNVKSIVDFVKNKKNRTEIVKYLAGNYSNVSFHTLNNIANPERIATHAAESNLGAHKGTTNLTKNQIEDIASDVSAHLIFVEGIIGAFGKE